MQGVLDLDRSYLAVQGPPGTGKTYTASHVIARLVNEHGYRIGVVAQSHAIVENLLERVVEAGVPAAQVAKAPKDPHGAEPGYTVIRKDGMAAYLAEHGPAGDGCVVGGTAWDFSNTRRVQRGELDLLVIDEAGQFSLASTIAVAASAQRLLLLGDPQQLPQVSQGTHPEPVDTSALGWVMHERAVIDPAHGSFLARSWRMHPAVAAPVSQLAYAGALASAEGTEQRAIDGVEPGLHVRPIRHRGNATQSPEEAAEVVRIVRDLVGRTYTDGMEAHRRARWSRRTSSWSRRTTRRSSSSMTRSRRPASATSRSARSTTSRARRPWSRSRRWPRRADGTPRAARSSCCCRTG